MTTLREALALKRINTMRARRVQQAAIQAAVDADTCDCTFCTARRSGDPVQALFKALAASADGLDMQAPAPRKTGGALMDANAVNNAQAELLADRLLSMGYIRARVLPDGSVAALVDLIFTRAICLGCNDQSCTYRFCFEDRALADQRFAELQSEDDVPQGHVASRGREGVAA